MGLGAKFGALLAGPLYKYFFSGVGHSVLLRMLIFHIKKFHVVPPTFDQIQFWAEAQFGLLMGPKQRKIMFCLWPLYTRVIALCMLGRFETATSTCL